MLSLKYHYDLLEILAKFHTLLYFVNIFENFVSYNNFFYPN